MVKRVLPAMSGAQRYLIAKQERLGGAKADLTSDGWVVGTESAAGDEAAWQETRLAICQHLEEYIDGTVATLDVEIAQDLLHALRLINNRDPAELFVPLPKRRGESPDSLLAIDCKKTAVRYIRFCEQYKGLGLWWLDAKPRQTVKEKYAIASVSTVDRWLQSGTSWGVEPLAKLEQLPDGWLKGVRRDVVEQYRLLRAGLVGAAAQYLAKDGGSSGAVAHRSKKRPPT